MATSPEVLVLKVEHVQHQIDEIRRECARLFPEVGFDHETTVGYCSAAENLMGMVRAGIEKRARTEHAIVRGEAGHG